MYLFAISQVMHIAVSQTVVHIAFDQVMHIALNYDNAYT